MPLERRGIEGPHPVEAPLRHQGCAPRCSLEWEREHSADRAPRAMSRIARATRSQL